MLINVLVLITVWGYVRCWHEEALGEGTIRTLYFQNFSVSLNLFQNKKVNNNYYNNSNRGITVFPAQGQEL